MSAIWTLADALSLLASVGVAAGAILVALAVDRWAGEPPLKFHPVVWMGNYLGWVGRWVQAHTRQTSDSTPDFKAFWLAALVWSGGAAICLIVTWWFQQGALAGFATLGVVPGGLGAAVVLGVLLKPLLAWAMLYSEVQAVEQALDPAQGGSLAAGRTRLSGLVSRDVTALSESQVRESALESLAENLNDSVVAPLFWFVLLGLPGAALYRFANTADAMWGYPGVYKGQNWLWAGKWAARVDDVLSWLPARLTALLLAAISGGVNLKRLRGEAHRTPSPNSGWPMAAMALSLGVCLQKPRVYALNSKGCAPESEHTHQALFLASKVVLALVFASGATLIFIAIGYFLWS
ncbi:MAG: adenosylcobinamide-phosphate synthase CbiB [Rhodoferax sp.]